MSLIMNNDETLDAMLHELGLTRHEFEIAERARFEMSPRQWMHERLARLGYVPAAAINRLMSAKDAA